MPKQISKKAIFSKGRFTIKDINLKLDNNKEITYQIWDKADTAMLVPLTAKNEIVFITEYQTALDAPMLSLPKGLIEKGETSLAAANKELQEETGFRANLLEKIAVFTAIPGYVSGRTHIYLARELEESRLQGDEAWEMPVSLFPLADFEKLIDDKKLTEARMIAALYEARRFITLKP